MGNSSSEEKGNVSESNFSAKVIPDPVDASSLDPRISKWLVGEQMYTSSSHSKEDKSTLVKEPYRKQVLLVFKFCNCS